MERGKWRLGAVLGFEAANNALKNLIRFRQAKSQAVKVLEDFEEIGAFQVLNRGRKVAELPERGHQDIARLFFSPRGGLRNEARHALGTDPG